MLAILVVDVDDVAKYRADVYRYDDKGNGELEMSYIPFKPMPNKISTKKITGDDQASLMERCYIYGWDDCIREILYDRSNQERD